MIKEIEDFPFLEQIIEKIGTVIKDRHQRAQLKKDVAEIVADDKKRVFESLSRQEEFDWAGMEKYISENLLSVFPFVYLAQSRDAREELRKQVYLCAYRSA